MPLNKNDDHFLFLKNQNFDFDNNPNWKKFCENVKPVKIYDINEGETVYISDGTICHKFCKEDEFRFFMM